MSKGEAEEDLLHYLRLLFSWTKEEQRPKPLNTCMHTQMHMATKTISIMDDVYELLVKNKEVRESFSDVIRKNLTKNNDIMGVVGLWSDLSSDEFKKVEKTIQVLRKSKRTDS